MSIDDMIGSIVDSLDRLGVLNNSYIIYTSDVSLTCLRVLVAKQSQRGRVNTQHGFHLGEFGMVMDKRLPYETDIRIPMIVRGPGIPRQVEG
jgi:arylsulfatase A-like enzyme